MRVFAFSKSKLRSMPRTMSFFSCVNLASMDLYWILNSFGFVLGGQYIEPIIIDLFDFHFSSMNLHSKFSSYK